MSDIFKNLFETAKAAQASHKTMIEEGVKIGRREMRLELYPLIRELINAVDDLAPDDGEDCADAEELIARAKALLDETAQPAGGEDAQ